MNTIDPNLVDKIIDELKKEIDDGVELAIQKTNPDIARRYSGNNIQIKNIMGNGLTIRKTKKQIQYIPSGSVDLNTAEQTFPTLPLDINTAIQEVANKLLANIHDQFKNKRKKQATPPPFIPQNIATPPPFIKQPPPFKKP